MKMKQLVQAINDNNPEQVGSLIDDIDTINEPLEKSALHEAQAHWTLLILACRHASFEVVKILVTSGADVNKEDEFGQTALYWTSVRDNHNDSVEIADLLLNNGLNVNAQAYKRDGRTALIGASFKGNNKLVDLFIKWGADPNILMDDKVSAFYISAQCSDQIIACKMGKSLIEAGANINQKRSVDGATAIYYAIEDGKDDFVKLMVESGYDLTIKRDADGYSALDYAVNVNQYKGTEFNYDNNIAKYLHNQGCEYDPALTELAVELWIDWGKRGALNGDGKERILELYKHFNSNEFIDTKTFKGIEEEFKDNIPEEVKNSIWELWLDKDFNNYWDEELEPKYNYELQFWVANDSEFGVDFLNALQEYIHSVMVSRSKDGMLNLKQMMSWGDDHNLNEIPRSKLHLNDQKMAILDILYRFHYYSWGYVDKGQFKSQQKTWFDDIWDIINNYV